MRIKPDSKSVHVAIRGNGFDPRAATATALARCGILSEHQAAGAQIHHEGPELASFTAGRCTVSVNRGHFKVESRRPPYRDLRDLALNALGEMPDRLMSSIHIDRTFHLPVRHPGRILRLLAEQGWISGFGNFLCAVDFQPEKPEGGCLWVFVGHSGLLADAGRSGIRVQVSDRYLGGTDRSRSNKLVATILETWFHESVTQADAIVQRVVENWH